MTLQTYKGVGICETMGESGCCGRAQGYSQQRLSLEYDDIIRIMT